MKKIYTWFTAALVVGLVAFSTPATADFVAGDTWPVGNYCIGVDREFIRQFTAAVVRGGFESYMAIVSPPSSPCYDVRFHSIQPVNVTLKERLWGFTMPDGENLVMWEVEDPQGNMGYTWLSPNWNEGDGV